MKHRKLIEWEKKLKEVFDKIDDVIEQKYNELYPLHPSRPARGTTANKAHDGLFDLGAAFSAGFGSEHGRGYIVKMRMATLADVPDETRETIENEVADLLRKGLKTAFPKRPLEVSRDGPIFKIHGDLSIGEQ
ncbi:MAG: hypothetical protein KAH23_04160 [Kiritimatiellae bacterium]|nr:hypothetical protein [Kiritimatiellia bacterium]